MSVLDHLRTSDPEPKGTFVRFGSEADKPSSAKIDLCALLLQ
jgi:hypothetical protein